jgi:hypothetical protein
MRGQHRRIQGEDIHRQKPPLYGLDLEGKMTYSLPLSLTPFTGTTIRDMKWSPTEREVHLTGHGLHGASPAGTGI